MPYSRQLDALRFVAVMLVLTEHLAGYVGSRISAGYFGVELFFVISGFLITRILLDMESGFLRAYRNFLGRRVLRIFPLYFALLALLLIMGYTYVNDYLLYFLTFSFNYAMAAFRLPTNAVTHVWSLCIEEQFYLFWPLFALTFRKNKKVLIAFLILFISICYGQFYFKWIPSLVPYTWVGLIPRSYAIGIGALGALAFKNDNLSVSWFSNKFTEWAVLFILILFLAGHHPLKFVIMPAASLFLVLKCFYTGFSDKRINAFFNNSRWVYLGTISYGIYLIHLPLNYYINRYFFIPFVWGKIDFDSLGYFSMLKNHAWLIKFPLITILTILLASFSYRYLETPFLNMKNRYFGSNSNMN